MCHGWKCIFGDPPLRSSLNCEELTRQGFLKELRRSGCILVALRIGSRAHWACSRQHRCKLRRQKTIDLTDTLLEHQREWWNGDSENNWLTFEAELFSSVWTWGLSRAEGKFGEKSRKTLTAKTWRWSRASACLR